MMATPSSLMRHESLTSNLPRVAPGQLRMNHGLVVMVLAPAHLSYALRDEKPAGWNVIFVCDSLAVEKRLSRWDVGECRYLADRTLWRYFELVSDVT